MEYNYWRWTYYVAADPQNLDGTMHMVEFVGTHCVVFSMFDRSG